MSTVAGYKSLPENVTRSLSDVIDNLGKAVTSGNLIISLPDPLGNGTVSVVADADYFVTIAGRNSAHSYVPKNIHKGFSSGNKHYASLGQDCPSHIFSETKGQWNCRNIDDFSLSFEKILEFLDNFSRNKYVLLTLVEVFLLYVLF